MSPLLESVLTAAGGALAGATVMAVPLLRQQHALRVAVHQAAHDDTTGLPNRRALLSALRRSTLSGRPYGLILLDLDGFKAVNDTYGHETGNDLLTVVGQRLAALPDPVRLVARLSGDEFVILADGGTDELDMTARLAAAAIESEPVTFDDGGQLTLRVSVGYTTVRLGAPARTLLREADEAMYHAKAHGARISRYPTGAAPASPPAGYTPQPRHRDRR